MAKRLKPVYPTLGELLTGYKADAGITDAELGQLCGLSECTVRFYRTGRRMPLFPQAVKLARALGIPLDRLAKTKEVQEG